MDTLEDTKVIRTARLSLRPGRAEDEEPLFPLFANWQVIRWLTSPPWPYRREDMQTFRQVHANTEDPETRYVICLGTDPIGCIGVRMRRASNLQRGAGPNIGYWIGQPYWGRGYMSEAAGAIVAHVFASGPHDAVYSGALAGNDASLRVQAKLGFVRDGETVTFARPHGWDLAHINTMLTRTTFEKTQ